MSFHDFLTAIFDSQIFSDNETSRMVVHHQKLFCLRFESTLVNKTTRKQHLKKPLNFQLFQIRLYQNLKDSKMDHKVESLKFAVQEVNRKLNAKGHFTRSSTTGSSLSKILLPSLNWGEISETPNVSLELTPTMVENDANVLNVIFRLLDTVDLLRQVNESHSSVLKTNENQVKTLKSRVKALENDIEIKDKQNEMLTRENESHLLRIEELEKTNRSLTSEKNRLLNSQDEIRKLAQREVKKRDLLVGRLQDSVEHARKVPRHEREVMGEINGNIQRKDLIKNVISSELSQSLQATQRDLLKVSQKLKTEKECMSLIYNFVLDVAKNDQNTNSRLEGTYQDVLDNLPRDVYESESVVSDTLLLLISIAKNKNVSNDKLLLELKEKKATIENMQNELNSLNENHSSLMKTMEGWRKFRKELNNQ
ncbi:unnamed protein product [Kuraishia capsulata CBS 1993]|uniref:Autophagy-related protein 25 n=1 Tax=Kuraishia capsulata CBS 1993 TaxID=1382522 RepID=W6MMN8_9ASCO|nr:uncharacterized protein KUCA_T00003848001 [Kuraishia capsulata CBS 1993]CDK27869.1 unnamed protein product [Kuraishia capsulata CBS 1993]